MNKDTYVHLFHILIIGTLFLYLGIEKTNIPSFMYPILIVLGIIVILYHSYKAYNRIMKHETAWVNYIHIFIVGPLLIYIGYKNKATKPRFFEILLMLGFAAIGYHGYYLFQK